MRHDFHLWKNNAPYEYVATNLHKDQLNFKTTSMKQITQNDIETLKIYSKQQKSIKGDWRTSHTMHKW